AEDRHHEDCPAAAKESNGAANEDGKDVGGDQRCGQSFTSWLEGGAESSLNSCAIHARWGCGRGSPLAGKIGVESAKPSSGGGCSMALLPGSHIPTILIRGVGGYAVGQTSTRHKR